MISNKAKYAFKALLYLGRRGRDTVQLEEIAADEGIPRKFLEHILLELKHSGLIASRRGRTGGYQLIRRPEDITIGQVLRIIDGPMAPLPCISRTAYRRCDDCLDEASCGVRRVFAGAYDTMLSALDGTSLASAALPPLTVDRPAPETAPAPGSALVDAI